MNIYFGSLCRTANLLEVPIRCQRTLLVEALLLSGNSMSSPTRWHTDRDRRTDRRRQKHSDRQTDWPTRRQTDRQSERQSLMDQTMTEEWVLCNWLSFFPDEDSSAEAIA